MNSTDVVSGLFSSNLLDTIKTQPLPDVGQEAAWAYLVANFTRAQLCTAGSILVQFFSFMICSTPSLLFHVC
jgi:hypothetical protein